MSLKPETRVDPAQGSLMNASMMIEVARRVQTPQAREFLAAYHDHETRIAGENPDLSEEAIRSKAAIEAIKAMGKRVTVGGIPV